MLNSISLVDRLDQRSGYLQQDLIKIANGIRNFRASLQIVCTIQMGC
jgi:hypothetical protein